MGCTGLNTASGGRYESFNGSGIQSPREFLFIGFDTLDNGYCEKFFVYTTVESEYIENFGVCFLFCEVCGVTFLPKEFTGSEEGLGVFEFPADDGVPLIEFEREVAVGADPFGVVGVHDGFGGGTDGDGFFEVGLAAFGESD